MLHGLLPDLWGLVFTWLPPRDLLQFLLVDKAFSAEIRRDKHWRHRAGTLSFFTRLTRVARQLKGDAKGTHTLELAYYCLILSLGARNNWLSDYAGKTRHAFCYSMVVKHNGVSYGIRETWNADVVAISFPVPDGYVMHPYTRSFLVEYVDAFMAVTSGAPKSLVPVPPA